MLFFFFFFYSGTSPVVSPADRKSTFDCKILSIYLHARALKLGVKNFPVSVIKFEATESGIGYSSSPSKQPS